jgi:hypothetical protein
MRPFVLFAITALALAACDKDPAADSGNNAGGTLTADTIVANDVTAIDAVTADAANMAADINYAEALAELSNNGDSNASGGNASRSRRSTPGAAPPTRAAGPTETPPDPDTNAQ